MACRYTYKGKTYEAWDFVDVIRAMPLTESAKFISGVEALPSAPFVADTEQWAGLAFKRALRWAAENNFDRVAWTTGEMQAARYDLSKQVKEISYLSPRENLTQYALEAIDLHGNHVDLGSHDADKLDDVVGKELAEKIRNKGGEIGDTRGWRVLRGLDLKVGGAGMKGFYDKILPAFVSKYVKKWGAKVGTTKLKLYEDPIITNRTGWESTGDVATRGEGDAVIRLADNEYGIVRPDGTTYGFWERRQDAEQWLRDTPVGKTQELSEVHSVDVTDEMRASVQQGQPMFALRPRPAGPAGGIFGDQTQNLARDEDAHEETVMPLVQALRQPGSMIPESVRAAADRWRTAIQDRFLPLLRTQQAIEESLGRQLTDEENTYRAETLSYGRKGAKLDDLADNHVTPLFEEMQRRGVSVDELEMYLYARHAPERNARIASINPEFAEGEGSGMTDAEAEEIMNAVQESGKLLDIEWLAARVDEIRDNALRERVEAGLLSQEQADAWRETYENYVPLRGRGELDPTLEADRPHLSSGISVKGPESRRAFGRRSRATDILAYTIMQAQEAILRAENNRVAQAFHQLAANNPNPDFWTVNKITTKPVWNSTTGQVEYRSSSRITAEDADYTISLKIDGTEHRVTLNRENPDAVRLAEAMRNLKPEQINGFIRVFGSVNRFLSTVNTTLNYEFVITNAFRDLQTAVVNLNQYDMEGIVQKTLKDYFPAMKAATKGAFHNFEGEWGRWYKEFRDAGGRVYFNTVEDIRQQRRNVEKAVRDAQPGFSARRAMTNVFQVIERLNNGVENAIRLAAYKNAREAGLSKDQAAELAKNLTVNFNRRGSYGPLINSLYLFFNASVQGTATLLTAMRSPAVRKILGGAVATGALVAVLNAMVSGTDDDDEKLYDKIPEFDKQRNLIIMDPFSGYREYWKIPLPYGYNVFFNIGRGMVDLARGKDVGKVMASQAEAIVDSFNPIGGAQNLLNMVAPTIVDPIVDLFRNRDFADRPIMPENPAYGPPIPNNQRYWGSVSPFWRTVTDTLNKISGGDDVVPGKIDWSPEVLDYLFGVGVGAAGLSWERLAALPLKIMDPTSEMTWNDIPMIRRVKGTKAPWIDRDLFYDRTEEVALHMRNYKDYAKKDRMDEADAYYEANKEMINLAPMADKIRDVLALTRRTNAAERFRQQEGEITREEYLQGFADRRAIEQEYITLFNRSYLEAKKANGN